MSDNWADEATKTYTPRGTNLPNRAGDAVVELTRLRDRIAELERREALLTAFVDLADRYADGYYAQMGETDAGIALHKQRALLDWIPGYVSNWADPDDEDD